MARGRLTGVADGGRQGTGRVMAAHRGRPGRGYRRDLPRFAPGSSTVLDDVRVAVADWPQMRARAHRACHADLSAGMPGMPRAEATEASAFLGLARRQPLHLSRLPGLSRSSAARRRDRLVRVAGHGPRPAAHRRAAVRDRSRSASRGKSVGARARPDVLVVTKANSVSTVHRATYLDYVGVKTFDAHGESHRRAPLHRALHLLDLQRQPARDPAAASTRCSASST